MDIPKNEDFNRTTSNGSR